MQMGVHTHTECNLKSVQVSRNYFRNYLVLNFFFFCGSGNDSIQIINIYMVIVFK
jgi:hypothetical protein